MQSLHSHNTFLINKHIRTNTVLLQRLTGSVKYPAGKKKKKKEKKKGLNHFTAVLAALPLEKRPIKVPNLKSLRLFPFFA